MPLRRIVPDDPDDPKSRPHIWLEEVDILSPVMGCGCCGLSKVPVCAKLHIGYRDLDADAELVPASVPGAAIRVTGQGRFTSVLVQLCSACLECLRDGVGAGLLPPVPTD
jgi:hypothetical protein